MQPDPAPVPTAGVAPSPALSDAPSELVRGDRLGRCRILRRLSRGALAETYLALLDDHPSGFHRRVTLQQLLPELLGDEAATLRFCQQARALAALDHPNLPSVLEVTSAPGRCYLVAEHADGADLRTLLNARGHGLPLEHAVEVVAAVLAGLQHAHERLAPDGRPLRIVHGSVGAEQVVITRDGAIKLRGFLVGSAGRREVAHGGARDGDAGHGDGDHSDGHGEGPSDGVRGDLRGAGLLLDQLRGADHGAILDDEDDRTDERPWPPPADVAAATAMPGQREATDTDDRTALHDEIGRIVARAVDEDRASGFASARAMRQALESLAQRHGLRSSSLALAACVATPRDEPADARLDATRSGPLHLPPTHSPSTRAQPARSGRDPAMERPAPRDPPLGADAGPYADEWSDGGQTRASAPPAFGGSPRARPEGRPPSLAGRRGARSRRWAWQLLAMTALSLLLATAVHLALVARARYAPEAGPSAAVEHDTVADPGGDATPKRADPDPDGARAVADPSSGAHGPRHRPSRKPAATEPPRPRPKRASSRPSPWGDPPGSDLKDVY